MKRSDFTPFIVIVAIVGLLLATSLPSGAASFSGRVVDEEGQPVEGLTIALPSHPGDSPLPRNQRVQIPLPQALQNLFAPSKPSETDALGVFSIRNIASPSVSRLTLLPKRNSDYEIRSIEIEGTPFYLGRRQHHFGGFNFAIAAGAEIKNVEITVRQRMRISGQAVFSDGTPLRNARVNLGVKRRNIDGRGQGSSSGSTTLDAEGKFVEYVDRAAYYTLILRHQGQTVESDEILLEEGQRVEGLVLNLGDKPEPPEPQRVDPEKIRTVLVAPPADEHAGFHAVVGPLADERSRFQAARKREREGMWAINPDNRHAYKLVHCETREEAQKLADNQEAHLVAINDKAEQEWLLQVFGERENYWIGAMDGGKEPQWDNGEPVTYANWISPQAAAKITKADQASDANPNYVVLIGISGKWQVARPGSPLIGMTERAILEKANFVIGAPEVADGPEKP